MRRQQIRDTDVFVEIRPVDAITPADQVPLVPFLVSSMGQARIPYDWDKHRSPVFKIDGEPILTHSYDPSQTTHSITRKVPGMMWGSPESLPRRQGSDQSLLRTTTSVSPEAAYHSRIHSIFYQAILRGKSTLGSSNPLEYPKYLLRA